MAGRDWRVVEGGRRDIWRRRLERGGRKRATFDLRVLLGAALLFALSALAVVEAGSTRRAASGWLDNANPFAAPLQPRQADDMAGGNVFTCAVIRVHDGDTLTCTDGTRVRVGGIAAREIDGTCRRGHPCPQASAEAARAALRRLALGRTLRCEATGTSYDRVAAFCVTPGGVDLSCAMVNGGWAAPWERHGYGARCRA